LARLPALIDAYAAFDGRDHATIKLIARTIREAGLIPTTKRGSGASTMSEREVVNLLLGANGAEAPVAAPQAVDRLRRLALRIPEYLREDLGLLPEEGSPPILLHMAKQYLAKDFADTPWRDLAHIGHFGDALEWVVRNAASIENDIIKLSASHIAERSAARQKEDKRIAVQIGMIGSSEQAIDWRSCVFVRLTIGHADASFEISSSIKGFPSIRLDYWRDWTVGQEGNFEENLYRRAYVELDFAVILALSKLVRNPSDPAVPERAAAGAE
jgi:hypothetical protein